MTSGLARKPGLAGNHGDHARAEELEQLKLALATFALQLDAFEMRTHGLLPAVSRPGNAVPLADRRRGPRKEGVIAGQ